MAEIVGKDISDSDPSGGSVVGSSVVGGGVAGSGVRGGDVGAGAIPGRERVRARVTALADRLRAGNGDALVLVGTRGSGRTTLLADCADAVGPLRVARLVGVPAEAELPRAGLDRLCGAAGIDPVDGTGIGELAPALHTRLAAAGPLLCLVDDAEWLDPVSLDVLAFVARRCADGPLAMVLAVAPDSRAHDRLAGPDSETLAPLTPADAAAVLPDRIVPVVQEELVEAAGGNLADLCELADALTPAQAAGTDAPPRTLPVDGRQRERVVRTWRALPEQARDVVLRIACAEPAEPPGDDATDALTADAEVDGVAGRVRASGLVRRAPEGLRPVSPVVGATVYAAAREPERRRAHAEFAARLDPRVRRATWTWHRARADGEPDVSLADTLADLADDDPATSALAWYRAARLTPSGTTKAVRLRTSALRHWDAGHAGPARRLLRRARQYAPSGAEAGRILLAGGEIELRDGVPEVAAHQLLLAADALPQAEAADAFLLAGEARRMAADKHGYLDTAARAAERGTGSSLVGAHLAGMAAMLTTQYDTAGEALRGVIADAGADVRDALCAGEAAMTLGRPHLAHDKSAEALARVRADGAGTLLPTALFQFALTSALLDRPHAALEASGEGVAWAVSAGQRNTAAELEVLAALAEVSLGDRDAALARVGAAQHRIDRAGLGRAAAIAEWVRACADLLDDRPADALRRLSTLFLAESDRPMVRVAAVPQLVECAIRCGESARARQALERYETWAQSTGTGVWLALAHRCRALLAEDPADAEEHFRRAIALQRSGGMTLELARTELAHAHRLRRQRRSREARSVLRDAFRLADDAGAGYWAGRIRDELRAAGDRAETDPPSSEDLTPQQERIVRLVANGRTNREIAERLTISQRTVEHHLRNIFVRLGVRSRVELAATAPRNGDEAGRVR